MKKNFYMIISIALLSAFMLSGCEEIIDEALEEVVEETEAVDEKTETIVHEEALVSEKPLVNENAKFIISTTDINGNSVSNEDFSDAKLIMVNFWEPWCGPCVNEMPDLERIYEEYSSDGLVILGVFSSTGMDDEVREVLDYCGTTYPVLRYQDQMEPYTSDYVPTTVFLNQNGNVLTDEPIIGANSYDDWTMIIDEYMSIYAQ